VLLAPAEFAIELPIADMHDEELRQRSAVWLWKDEADCVRIKDL
jgi:hypothetical protein